MKTGNQQSAVSAQPSTSLDAVGVACGNQHGKITFEHASIASIASTPSTKLVERLRRNRPPEWCRLYVGKKFQDHGRGPDAYDCWGLALTVLRDQFGITGLPDYGDAYIASGNWHSVSKAVGAGLQKNWRKLGMDDETIELLRGEADPLPGDLVIINLAGRPFHCGIFVAQPDWMLHALAGTDVVLEQLSRPMWSKGNRIEGIYRYAGIRK